MNSRRHSGRISGVGNRWEKVSKSEICSLLLVSETWGRKLGDLGDSEEVHEYKFKAPSWCL